LFSPNEKKEHSLLLALLFFAYLCSDSRIYSLLFTKRKSMRISSLLALSSWCLFGLFSAVSCDDLSAEPAVSPSYVEIPAEGGEAMTQLKQTDGGKWKSKWAFRNVYLGQGVSVKDSALHVDTLTDGRVKYAGEWYAFYVSKQRNVIQVELSPNESRTQRSVTFCGEHTAGHFTSFHFVVSQKPITPMPN
jgi:hypothetical protein